VLIWSVGVGVRADLNNVVVASYYELVHWGTRREHRAFLEQVNGLRRDTVKFLLGPKGVRPRTSIRLRLFLNPATLDEILEIVSRLWRRVSQTIADLHSQLAPKISRPQPGLNPFIIEELENLPSDLVVRWTGFLVLLFPGQVSISLPSRLRFPPPFRGGLA